MKHTEKILVTSLKGGVGKSTVSAALAAAFAGMGSRVLLCDLDFRARSLELMLGAAEKTAFNLCDYINGKCDAGSVLVTVPVRAGLLLFCPAPDEDSFGVNGPVGLDSVPFAVSDLAMKAEADVVILDTGAESTIPRVLCRDFAETVLVVSEQSRTSIRAAEITADKLSRINEKIDIKLVINDFDVDLANRKVRAGLLEMIDDAAIRCVGVIPHDSSIPLIADSGVLPTFGPVAAAAENTAKRIRGENVPLFQGVGKLRRRIRL
ncbi:MAG: P-loop NTPase [Clostridia bacterium]|nr:P-loop NTPase [Clostridia bacterium]